MKKPARNFLILAFITIIAVILIASGGKIKLAIGAESYVQAPTFFYYECAPASAPVDSPTVNIKGGTSGWIQIPGNTDQADLYIQSTEVTNFFSLGRRIVYQICDSSLSNCQAQQSVTAGFWSSKNGKPTVVLSNLNKNDRVYVDYQKCIGISSQTSCLGGWINTDGANYFARYKPFILWKTGAFSGGRTEYTTAQQGCVFPSSGNLIDAVSNLKVNLNVQTSTSDYRLEPYKTRNVIDTYVELNTENVNFVNYNGKQGYCLNRQVFAISTVTTNSGVIKIVDSNFNTLLTPSVTCCPGEKEPTRTCTSNFQWQTISVTQPSGSCSAFKPCAGADYSPSGSKELVRYNCVNSQCVPETKKVECTTNTDCIGNSKGALCDTLTYQCSSVATPTATEGKRIGSSDCKWYDVSCQLGKLFEGTKTLLTYVKYAFIAIFSILGLFVLSDKLERIPSLKRRNKTRWAVSLIITSILAYALILFIGGLLFWITLIVVGVLLYYFFPAILGFLIKNII